MTIFKKAVLGVQILQGNSFQLEQGSNMVLPSSVPKLHTNLHAI